MKQRAMVKANGTTFFLWIYRAVTFSWRQPEGGEVVPSYGLAYMKSSGAVNSCL